MKTRIIHTRFWQDSYITKLSHKEKLTFVYLLTNDHVSLTGIYELPDKYIQFDLDLNEEEINSIKEKFQKDNKIFFIDGWIKILNHDKYNSFKGEKIEIAKAKELEKIPLKIKQYQWGIDTSINTSIDTPSNDNHNNKDKDKDIQQKPIVDKKELLKRLGIENVKGASYEWQDYAIRLWGKLGLGDRPSSGWFKLFKMAFINNKKLLLDLAYSFVQDANAQNPERLFYWKFNRLLKGEEN
jgi:hypothetical protein